MSKSILPLSGCLYISKDLCLQIKFLQNPETPYLTDRLGGEEAWRTTHFS